MRRSLPLASRAAAYATTRRTLCTPAAVPQVVTDIREAVADLKAKMDAKPTGDTYTAEGFEAAIKSGSVDVSMMSSTLSDFDAGARKLAIKCVSDSNMMAKERASEEATMADYDWSQWEKKGLDAATIAEVKALMSEGIEAEKKLVPELMKENELDALEKEIVEAFKGPDGFLEMASKEEKAAQTAMLSCIAELDKLELDAVGIREVTIAEILEREPELRKEIEEEIANNNWGY